MSGILQFTSPSDRRMKGHPVVEGMFERFLGLFVLPPPRRGTHLANWLLLGESSRAYGPYISPRRCVGADP